MEQNEAIRKEAGKDSTTFDWFEQDAEVSHEQTDLSSYNLIRDREKRSIKAPSKYGYADIMTYAFSVAEDLNSNNPKTYLEAIACKEKDKRMFAMEEEIQSLYKNDTWRLVDTPNN